VIENETERRKWIVMFLVAAASTLSGCTAMDARTCPAGLGRFTEANLYFGRGIAGGASVSDADWQSFVDSEIAPRFPDGLTVEDASSQWKDANGIVREKSKRLTIILPGKADDEARLAAIRIAYKFRFRQDAVLLMETEGCGSF